MARSMGSTRFGASLSEDGSRAGCRNVVFCEIWTVDKVQNKDIVSVGHTVVRAV